MTLCLTQYCKATPIEEDYEQGDAGNYWDAAFDNGYEDMDLEGLDTEVTIEEAKAVGAP